MTEAKVTFQGLRGKWEAVSCGHYQDGGCTCEGRAQLCAIELELLQKRVEELRDGLEAGRDVYDGDVAAVLVVRELTALLGKVEGKS